MLLFAFSTQKAKKSKSRQKEAKYFFCLDCFNGWRDVSLTRGRGFDSGFRNFFSSESTLLIASMIITAHVDTEKEPLLCCPEL